MAPSLIDLSCDRKCYFNDLYILKMFSYSWLKRCFAVTNNSFVFDFCAFIKSLQTFTTHSIYTKIRGKSRGSKSDAVSLALCDAIPIRNKLLLQAFIKFHKNVINVLNSFSPKFVIFKISRYLLKQIFKYKLHPAIKQNLTL